MESLTWFLTFAAVGAWVVVGAELVLRPLPHPRGWSSALRRGLWGVVGLVALVAGSWGPELWSRTSSDYADDPSIGAPAARTSSLIRTPVAVQSSFRDVDADDRLIRTESRLALQFPVALLFFLGGVLFLRWRERSRGGGDPGRATGGPGNDPTRRGATRSAGLALVLALVAAGACGTEGTIDGASAPRPDRALAEVEWDTLLQFAPGIGDTLFYSADHAVGSERGFWVLDRIGSRIAHFGWNGELRWYAGRQGSGPGELLNPRMLDLDAQDRVWVLDVDNQRISGFDADGIPVDDVPLGNLDALIHAFAADADGERFFGMVASDGLRPVAIDRNGRASRGDRIPIRDLPDGSSSMALQGAIASDRDGDGWVYALTMGDGFFRMNGLELVEERVRYPEWVPFPGTAVSEDVSGDVRTRTTQLTEPNFSANGVAFDRRRILVPFDGTTEDRRRLVDLYDPSGTYEESILLPRTGRMGAWRNRVILVWNDPGPHLAVLRRRR